jgi:hypothetical protein
VSVLNLMRMHSDGIVRVCSFDVYDVGVFYIGELECVSP